MMAMRHFLPRGSGKIVNILGQGAKKPAPYQNAYGSSKAWIRVFTMAVAKEYKKSGVGVYALQPGLMETDLLTELITFKEHEKTLRNIMPMLIRGGGKKPDVAARKALWLVSSATDGRTGLYVSVGSTFAFLVGFLHEGFCKLLHLPVRKIELNIKIIPSAFEPLGK
jgi:glucose 1-dehydrogenase